MSPRLHMWYQWSLGLFLNCVDFYVTKAYIGKVGELGEFNILMLKVIQRFGIYGLLYVKLFFFAFLGSMMIFLAKKSYAKVGDALAWTNIVFGCVIGWGLNCLLST